MEVRLSAKVGETEIGVGVLILDMSKLFQVLQSTSMSTPSSFSGHVSHVYSPIDIPQLPLSLQLLDESLSRIEDGIEVVAASTLPILTPSMSSTLSTPSVSLSHSTMIATINDDSNIDL